MEAELGTMREQLSSELRKAVGEKVGVGGAISDTERGSVRK